MWSSGFGASGARPCHSVRGFVEDGIVANRKAILNRAKKGATIRQVAAIPCRVGKTGEVEVMLITSRETKRFIVPKGWPMKKKSAAKAAAIEAVEEAGVVGKIAKEPFASYSYWKRIAQKGIVRVTVRVFLLTVTETLTDWKEAEKRERAWLRPSDAASLIDEPELATIVGSIAAAPQPRA
jgi:8-oxo-dGTP pyrophosphatase MutT (NUDIX family)